MSLQIVRKLSGKELQAAQLIVDGELSLDDIAIEVGVAKRTLIRWKERPNFELHMGRLREEIAAALKAEGIRRRENRLANYQDRIDRLQRIIEARAADRFYAFEPGYSTGLMVRDVKSIQVGDDHVKVELFKVDTGLLSAMLALEKQAAQDSGQWSEKEDPSLTNLNGRKTTMISTVYLGVPRPSFDGTPVAVQQVVEIEE